jgi:flagellar operon protein (TIGR03826 family)
MDVRNCKSCGKIFNYISGQPLCPSCMKALEVKFGVVKEYIYNNPGAGMQEVAEENDVTTTQIQKWIREERLSFAEDSMVGIDCENCGASIKTGRYCKSCKDKLANNLGNLYKEKESEAQKKPDSKNNPKMRYL